MRRSEAGSGGSNVAGALAPCPKNTFPISSVTVWACALSVQKKLMMLFTEGDIEADKLMSVSVDAASATDPVAAIVRLVPEKD